MFNQSFAHSVLAKTLPVAAIASLGLTIAVHSSVSAASLTPVDLELSLLIDVSPSVSNQNYALQIGGYKEAFTKLSSQFGAGGFGNVAINLIEWAGGNQQQQSISWKLVNDQASALQFANAIGALLRPANFSGTAPGSAIQFATPLFSSNDYDGQRWVIDVSGDGAQNAGVSTSLARDNALAAGVDAINGLPIDIGSSTLIETWYRNNIQGGAGSFVIPAKGFTDFGRAIEQKLFLELSLPPTNPPDIVIDPPSTAVPEPATMLGITLAGGGLAWLKRRRSV
jgi:Protein of unknown function (DUF1194)